jgi:hypothetical protein
MRWINRNKWIPAKKGEYLVVHQMNRHADIAEFGRYRDDETGKLRWGFYTDGDIWGNVTHWMLLPEPPK